MERDLRSPVHEGLQVAPKTDLPYNVPHDGQTYVANVDDSPIPRGSVIPGYTAGGAVVKETPDAPVIIYKEARICGMRTTTFLLTVALILLVIGAAVGGGVGGSMCSNALNSARSACKSNGGSSSGIGSGSGDGSADGICTSTVTSTVRTTQTSTTSVFPTSTGRPYLVALDCPSLDGTTYTTAPVKTSPQYSYKFKITCGQDMGGWTNQGVDIVPVVSYTIEDCMIACAGYNAYHGGRGCLAVVFNAFVKSATSTDNGNCWLKNDTTNAQLIPQVDSRNYIAGAIIAS